MEDTQKNIIIWASALLVVIVAGFGAWQIATGSPTTKPVRPGTLSESVIAGEWTKGAKDPVVTLVEYSDFQCPACGLFSPLVDQITEEYKDRLSFTYRHFPLPQHKNALIAAHTAEAAGKQGKFWEMSAKIFSTQNDWSEGATAKEVFEGFARELGLDMTRFTSDRDSQETKDAVLHDMETGRLTGVAGTPSFYLNGKKMQNPRNYQEFKALIDYAITHP